MSVGGVPSLKPSQTMALCLIGSPLKPCELLMVDPTNMGKTDILKVAGAIEKGGTPIL